MLSVKRELVDHKKKKVLACVLWRFATFTWISTDQQNHPGERTFQQ